MLKFNKDWLPVSTFWWGIGIVFSVFVVDQISKHLVFAVLERIVYEQRPPFIYVTSFFNLVYVWNRGISFGMFNSLHHSKLIFLVLNLIVILAILAWLYHHKKFYIALGLIAGGAFGNSIDRLRFGAVADFLDFHLSNFHWPAFNFADSMVCIGVVVFLIEDFFYKRSQAKIEKKNGKNESSR